MMTVVILCGGRGIRLRPLTDHIPKPLIPLNGTPILQHIIEFFIGKNIRRFILCTGFRSDAIRDFISSRHFVAEIEICDSGPDAGMLKRLYLARDMFGDRAMITYGDTYIDLDPALMLKEHLRSCADVSITIASSRSPFGHVSFDHSTQRVTSFEEKPSFTYYIGNMILEKKVLEWARKELIDMPDGQGLIELFGDLIQRQKLFVYEHQGLQLTFNTLYQYRTAEREFLKFFTEQGGGDEEI